MNIRGTKLLMEGVVVLLALVTLSRVLGEGEPTGPPPEAIFIGPVEVRPSVVELAEREANELELRRISQSLETQFVRAVSAAQFFRLVDRRGWEEIQPTSGGEAVGQEAEVDLKRSGAKHALLPEIDGFEIRTVVDRYEAIDRESVTRKYFLSALVRIVDTSTGEMLPAAPSLQLERVETVEMAGQGKARADDRVLVELAREMASRLNQEVVSRLRPAKVLKVTPLGTGKIQILINRGTEAGFDIGDLVEVYHTEDVVDQETGRVYQEKLPLCLAKIVRSETMQSSAISFGDDLGVAAGYMVELIDQSPGEKMVPPVTWSGGRVGGEAKETPPSVRPEPPGSSEEPLDWEE